MVLIGMVALWLTQMIAASYPMPWASYIVFYCIIVMAMNFLSYSGVFVFLDSSLIFIMLYLTGFVVGLVLMENKIYQMFYLSSWIMVFSMLFFVSSNYFVLFITYELIMLVIVIIIFMGGAQVEKISANYYLILYLMFCIFPFMLSLFYLHSWTTLNYFDILLGPEMKWALMMCFLVKIPLYGLHLWLPKAHVESPTHGSIILAGVLLKLSVVGLVRLLEALKLQMNYYVVLLCVVGMSVLTLTCAFQSDVKNMVAYSSVVHMNFVLLALLSMMSTPKMGSSLLAVSHGFTSSMVFYISGVLFYSNNSRKIYYIGGIAASSTLFLAITILILFSNFSVPPTVAFVGEFMMITSSIAINPIISVVLGMYVLGVCYYTLFLLINFILGKSLVMFKEEKMLMGAVFVIISFNILFLMLASC